MSTSIGQKRKEAEVQATTETTTTAVKSKQTKVLTIGRHIEELKGGEHSIYFKVASTIMTSLTAVTDNLGWMKKAQLGAKYGIGIVAEAREVRALWEKATSSETSDTEREEKTEFLTRMETFLVKNESMVTELCVQEANLDISAVREEAEAEIAELKKKSTTEEPKETKKTKKAKKEETEGAAEAKPSSSTKSEKAA